MALVDSRDRFITQYARTILAATKKEGPIKAAFRMLPLPIDVRKEVKSRMLKISGR